MAMEVNPMQIPALLQTYGGWAVCVFTTWGLVIERREHNKTKDRERERLLKELDILNRARGGADNV